MENHPSRNRNRNSPQWFSCFIVLKKENILGRKKTNTLLPQLYGWVGQTGTFRQSVKVRDELSWKCASIVTGSHLNLSFILNTYPCKTSEWKSARYNI